MLTIILCVLCWWLGYYQGKDDAREEDRLNG